MVILLLFYFAMVTRSIILQDSISSVVKFWYKRYDLVNFFLNSIGIFNKIYIYSKNDEAASAPYPYVQNSHRLEYPASRRIKMTAKYLSPE